MARRSCPEVPRVCLQCGVAWVQRDGRPPRDYCTTSCRNEAERQARGGAQILPEPDTAPPVHVYVRRVQKINGKLYNVEFDRIDAVKDPGK